MNNNPASLLFNLTEAVAATIKKAATDGVILASDEKVEQRIKLCYDCPELDKNLTRCNICGCFMKTKVRFESSLCPAGKW
jgi:hypothetical protein